MPMLGAPKEMRFDGKGSGKTLKFVYRVIHYLRWNTLYISTFCFFTLENHGMDQCNLVFQFDFEVSQSILN